MDKRQLALLLALAACAPAEAGPQHGPKHGPAMVPRSALSTDGQVLRRPWTNTFYSSSDCVASPNYTPFPDRTGALDGAINTLLQDYTCGVTTPNVSALGIGAAQIGQQINIGPTTSGCWNNNGTTLTWAGVADGEDFAFAVTFYDPDGEASNKNIATWRNAATEFMFLDYTSAEAVSLRIQEVAMGAQYIPSSSGALATGVLHHCTILVDGDNGGGFMVEQVWCDANAVVTSAPSASNPGPFATTGVFALGASSAGATCTGGLNNFEFVFLGIALGNAATSWITEAAHLEDCQNMGVIACQ